MNRSRVYICPSILNPPLPPLSASYPSGLCQSTSFGFSASCIELALVICSTCGSVHVSTLFSEIIPSSPPSTECTQVCIYSTEICECHVASLTSPKMSCTIMDPGTLAQTLLLKVRTICTPPKTFHSPGLWASTSKPHSNFLLSWADQDHRHCLMASLFLRNPHRLKAQKITQKNGHFFGLRNCFTLA